MVQEAHINSQYNAFTGFWAVMRIPRINFSCVHLTHSQSIRRLYLGSKELTGGGAREKYHCSSSNNGNSGSRKEQLAPANTTRRSCGARTNAAASSERPSTWPCGQRRSPRSPHACTYPPGVSASRTTSTPSMWAKMTTATSGGP